MKALGILVILFNSIFAGEAKSDSSFLRLLNSLKRQKIFYSSASGNWIPLTLPSDCCVSGGCCLFPVAAFTMHKISKADTIHKDTTSEKKYRWSIGIGYTGGICYTGKDLMRYLDDMTFDPIELILARLYWLNSLEASISHFPNKKWGVEVGGGYGWANRKGGGTSTDIYNVINNTDIHLRWGAQKIEKLYFSIGVKPPSKKFSIGLEAIYSYCKGIERYYENWDLKYTLIVVKKGMGGGVFLKWLTKANRMFYGIHLMPYISFKLAISYEFTNNSPLKDMWKDRLEINFSGLYIGVKLQFGGVK